MAQLDDIRQGMAGLLRAVLPVDEGQVSAYLEPTPNTPCLQVAGVAANGMEIITFGGSKRFFIVVEGVMGLTSDIGAQKILNAWLSENAVAQAVESDSNSGGALYSRLTDDGELLTDQEPAADSVGFEEYRGQSFYMLRDGREVLLATWVFEVLTSS